MTNNIISKEINQVCQKYIRERIKKKNWSTVNCYPIDEITQNKEKFFENLNHTQLKILDKFIFFKKVSGKIIIRQAVLGKQVDISREWCNKSLLDMEKWGIIASNYDHMHANEYKLSSWFDNEYIMAALTHILRSLRIGCLLALFPNSPLATYQKELFTRIEVRGKYLSKFSQQLAQYNNLYSHPTKRIVNMNAENPISITIREINCIKLTKWGQIRLSCFPDPALHYAIKNFKYGRQLRNPFGFFFQLCMDYCKNNELLPDWQYYEQLSVAYKMPENAPMLLEAKEQTVTAVGIKKIFNNNPKQDSKKYPAWKEPERYKGKSAEYVPVPDGKEGFVSMQALMFQTMLGLHKPEEKPIETVIVSDEPAIIDYNEYEETYDNMMIEF